VSRRVPARPGERDDDPVAAFVRGATVGAFVGAVIAGSTIWRLARRQPAGAPAGSGPPSGRARPPTEGPGPRRP
jgi:hypothetical protein